QRPVFTPVARIEAIRLFLAYASFKDFVVYQMDVKSGFLYRNIKEEARRVDELIKCNLTGHVHQFLSLEILQIFLFLVSDLDLLWNDIVLGNYNSIDYDEVFTPVARIELIRLFLAYASFKDFVVYQMDVRSAFLYRNIKEECKKQTVVTNSTTEVEYVAASSYCGQVL
nr:putative ribonuclease H-like domain-containing protein [Tanacetum cinerariifolium]